MRKIQFIIAGLCWLFISVSIVRLLIHIFNQEINSLAQALGFAPFYLFIGALMYFSGGLLWHEFKRTKKVV